MIYSVKEFFFLMCIVVENINIIYGRHVIYRHLWNARDETSALSRFNFPIEYYHTAISETEACNTTESCSLVVNKLQHEHMKNKGLPDIACNFLVDCSGKVYEGTGWYSRATQHKKEFLSICLFGIDNNKNITKNFVDGIKSILKFGKEFRYLSQQVKPLFKLNQTTESLLDKWQEQHDLMQQLINNTDNWMFDEHENGVHTESTNIFNTDWSKVFPNQSNRTELNKIVKDQKIIAEKKNWSKVFENKDQVTSIDWASLMRDNSINTVDWSGIFENDNDASNVNSFVLSSQLRVKNRLRRNNNE